MVVAALGQGRWAIFKRPNPITVKTHLLLKLFLLLVGGKSWFYSFFILGGFSSVRGRLPIKLVGFTL